MPPVNNILISRTDSVGDMVLTLPMAAVLKRHYPRATIGFLGAEYTRAVVNSCRHADAFILRDDFLQQTPTLAGQAVDCIIHVKPDPALARRAKQLAIPRRIGTTHRWFHWPSCNRLVRLSRSNSSLHEAQLNLALLAGLGIDDTPTLPMIADLYGLDNGPPLPARLSAQLEAAKFKLIVHPKSRGSAREWDIGNYAKLVNSLPDHTFQVLVTGTADERRAIQPLLAMADRPVVDLVGQMTLEELIALIAACDGLIACSTGPLHIAAALHKHALGLYPPIRPLDPGRWGPVGKKARVFVANEDCNACLNGKAQCLCMQAIRPERVAQALLGLCANGGGG